MLYFRASEKKKGDRPATASVPPLGLSNKAVSDGVSYDMRDICCLTDCLLFKHLQNWIVTDLAGVLLKES